VGVALLGLCVAGGLAGYLMQQEMVNSRVDEIHTIVDKARNLAIGLQKEVDAGKLSKAMAEFERIGNMLTYDHRNGYLFGATIDSITVLSPVPARSGRTAWTCWSMAGRSRRSGTMASPPKANTR
jgi:methyl-accepting chemotaxis protein